MHWLSFESRAGGGRLAYGRGSAVSHPATALGVVDLPHGAAPLARRPGALARLAVRVEVGGGGGGAHPPLLPASLASPYAARQAGRGAPAPLLTVSPHPLPNAAPSPLAAPAGWGSSLAALADPAAPVPAALLPPTCAAVVACLAAPGLGLPPGLAAAIAASLASPSGLLRRTLAAKAARGAPGYLRVGVAPRCGGLAPGEPFVLELWPAGSASPVHGHGGCCGGFVVLHGACTLRTFNSLDGGEPAALAPPSTTTTTTTTTAPTTRPPLFEGVCPPGTVGWFDHTRHQVHSIAAAVPLDVPGAFCATLQAFRYAGDDDVASPFMEIEGREEVAGCPVVCDVDPESDFEFTALAAALLAEHAGAGGGGTSCGAGSAVVALAAVAGPPPAPAGQDGEGAEADDDGEVARFVWVI